MEKVPSVLANEDPIHLQPEEETIFEHNAPPRTLKVLDIISAGFNICNSWAGLAGTLFLGIIAGGPVTIIYGTLVATFSIGCCVATVAELSSRYPTAGGQYHWTWLLAPPSIRRGAFSLNACAQTSSRLTWSFARDRALPFSSLIGKIHPGLGIPVWALIFNATIIFIMGCINLGSTTAFNAIVGACIILMHATFAIPAIFLMLSGRDSRFLPEKGHWDLVVMGWVFNFVTVAWALLVLVIYCLPSTTPTTASGMNYASVVLVVIAIFGLLNWFFLAKNRYQGPRIDLERIRYVKKVRFGLY